MKIISDKSHLKTFIPHNLSYEILEDIHQYKGVGQETGKHEIQERGDLHRKKVKGISEWWMKKTEMGDQSILEPEGLSSPCSLILYLFEPEETPREDAQPTE